MHPKNRLSVCEFSRYFHFFTFTRIRIRLDYDTKKKIVNKYLHWYFQRTMLSMKISMNLSIRNGPKRCSISNGCCYTIWVSGSWCYYHPFYYLYWSIVTAVILSWYVLQLAFRFPCEVFFFCHDLIEMINIVRSITVQWTWHMIFAENASCFVGICILYNCRKCIQYLIATEIE